MAEEKIIMYKEATGEIVATSSEPGKSKYEAFIEEGYKPIGVVTGFNAKATSFKESYEFKHMDGVGKKYSMPIKYVTGDATRPGGPGLKVIVHICNNAGQWGAGFVVPLATRYPKAKKDYLDRYDVQQRMQKINLNLDFNPIPLGSITESRVLPDTHIINMIAQDNVKVTKGTPRVKYNALADCLNKIAANYFEKAEKGQVTINMPRIGTGLGGGDWDIIETIIKRTLSDRGIPVVVYDLPSSAGSSH